MNNITRAKRNRNAIIASQNIICYHCNEKQHSPFDKLFTIAYGECACCCIVEDDFASLLDSVMDIVRDAYVMEEGIITPDSDFGERIGFTLDRFEKASYLWFDGERIMVSFIVSRHEPDGNLSKLFNNIEAAGLQVAVPEPTEWMRSILVREGFRPHVENMEVGPCEVWEKPDRDVDKFNLVDC